MNHKHLAWAELFPSLAAGDSPTRAVLDAARPVTLSANQPLFRAGLPCENYLLLLAGNARVQLTSENGREVVLYRVQPGQSCVLTTCCLISGDDYPAEGFTETAGRALLVSKPAFDAALESAPAFRRFVFANLAGRVADLITRMDEVAFRPIERRLVAFLLTRHDGSKTIHATHQEVAIELGTSREVVSRHLKRLEASGLVTLSRSTIHIDKLDGLQRVADASL